MSHRIDLRLGARALPAAWLLLGLLAAAPEVVLAQRAPMIEGVWRVTRSGVDCQTGAVLGTFGAIMTFSRDGKIFGSAIAPLSLPGRSSLEHGTWKREPVGHYSFRLLSYDYAADGAISGSTEISALAAVSDNGSLLTYDASIQFFDTAGNALNPPGSVCGKASATRFQ